jgi:hypothetical protein
VDYSEKRKGSIASYWCPVIAYGPLTTDARNKIPGGATLKWANGRKFVEFFERYKAEMQNQWNYGDFESMNTFQIIGHRAKQQKSESPYYCEGECSVMLLHMLPYASKWYPNELVTMEQCYRLKEQLLRRSMDLTTFDGVVLACVAKQLECSYHAATVTWANYQELRQRAQQLQSTVKELQSKVKDLQDDLDVIVAYEDQLEELIVDDLGLELPQPKKKKRKLR